jgi:hypothetical protein
MSHYTTRSSPTSSYTSQGLARFLVSREAAGPPATPQEKEVVLRQYLTSLAERPVQLFLAETTPNAAARNNTQGQ